jgi:hypothetical protein
MFGREDAPVGQLLPIASSGNEMKQVVTVTADSVQEASKGYVSQIDKWLTMIRHFCDVKLKDDADWRFFSELLDTLHLGKCEVARERIWSILEFHRKAHDGQRDQR